MKEVAFKGPLETKKTSDGLNTSWIISVPEPSGSSIVNSYIYKWNRICNLKKNLLMTNGLCVCVFVLGSFGLFFTILV